MGTKGRMDAAPEQRLIERLRGLPTALGRPAIPLADLGLLRRPLLRTTATRLGLLVALAALAAISIWRATQLSANALSFLPHRSSTILVLDQSKSVYLSGYREIAGLLDAFAQADAPVGLIMFSDTAYELLPPDSHGSELRPLLRYYTPTKGGAKSLPSGPQFIRTPWDISFSAGTKISGALQLGERLLKRERVQHGTLLLISDLDTADTDLPTLAKTLTQLRTSPTVNLRILALHPDPGPRRFVENIVGKKPFISGTGLAARHVDATQRFQAASPLWLVIPALLLLAAVAANELLCNRIELAPRQEATA
jgi:hypothetical protein